MEKGYFNKELKSKESKKLQTSVSVLDAKDKTVDDIVACLNAEAGRKDNEETVIKLLSELYDCMQKEKMLDVKVASKTKINILKCLYKYVESNNQVLLLSLARVILAVIPICFVFR